MAGEQEVKEGKRRRMRGDQRRQQATDRAAVFRMLEHGCTETR